MQQKNRYKTLLALFLNLFCFSFFSQNNPVNWNIKLSDSSILFEAKIEKEWHLYAVYLPSPNDGPLPTIFEFNTSNNYSLKDSVTQSTPITHFDKDFGVEVSYYENEAFFKQKIKIGNDSTFKIEGNISYMCCNEQTCIPLYKDFSIAINQD